MCFINYEVVKGTDREISKAVKHIWY